MYANYKIVAKTDGIQLSLHALATPYTHHIHTICTTEQLKGEGLQN
jgi:hypothetical protein